MAEETIQCWSCGTQMTLGELASNDGDCPECEVEIALAEYMSKALADNAALRAKPSQGGEAVATYMGTDWAAQSQFMAECASLEPGTKLYTRPADQVAEGVVVPLIKAAIKYIDSQVFYKFGEPVTKADREGRRIADELRQLLAKSEGVKK